MSYPPATTYSGWVTFAEADAIDRAHIGELLRAIDEDRGQPVTEYALRFVPLVFVRLENFGKPNGRNLPVAAWINLPKKQIAASLS